MLKLSPNFPFAPAKLPFFYGWVIVGVATLGIVMSVPGQTMGVSVFTDHLIRITGLTRLELTYTYLFGTLASSFLLPKGGLILDRHGSRTTGMLACGAVALTLCLLTQIDRLIVGLANALMSPTAVAAALLCLAFMMLRLSGQGILTMASRTMMAKWFEKRRGLASGLSGVFVSGGFAIAPLFLQSLIDFGGWRGAWWILAGLVGFGMGLVIFIFFRETPEECGLRMDGAAPDERSEDEATGVKFIDEVAYTRGEAMRTARFWYVTLALSLQAMVFTGVTFHIMDIGVDTGIGGREAVRLFIPNAIVSTMMGMLSGWAADRVPVRALVLAFVSFQTIAFVGAGRLGETPFMVMMIVGWGCAGGLFSTLLNVAVPNFFGRKHIGAISSVQMSVMVGASAVGPAMLAAAKTYLGSYRVGLLWCCALSLAVFLFALLAPSPSAAQPRSSAE
ncbi:MAG: OFA family oxalate/formate antiporter-like MFS transporter [Myxococcota bacterium]|jgi:OFA family oxalate/formate antiporter-like MFS transporter